MPRGRRLGSARVALVAAAIALACLVAGGIAVIHLNRTGPVAAASRVATASPGTPAPGSRRPAPPAPRPVRTAAPHPSASAAAHRPVPSAASPAVTNSKQGVGAWGFNGASQALAESGASWYYTWSASPGISGPPGVQFVPMIWGAADVTAGTL